MTLQSFILYAAIGAAAGIASGMFGVGGGLIMIPALVYFAGYSQLSATGTSLAVLLPPIGIAATIEYYRRGHVDLKAAIVMAICLMLSSWMGARLTRKFSELYLRLAFGIVLAAAGCYIAVSALRKLRM